MPCPPNVAVLCRAFLVLAAIAAYNEFFIYYVVLIQCQWPLLSGSDSGLAISHGVAAPLKVMLLADTHLLGPRGHWFDKLRREWQMERAFQTAMMLHIPDTVFILGDLFDEGEWTSDAQFADDVERFRRMFRHPDETQLIALVGNHDVGFHYKMTPEKVRRFQRATGSKRAVGDVAIRGISFVMVNSMAFEGDNCLLCAAAREQLRNVSDRLSCTLTKARDGLCNAEMVNVRPILLQHFPMHRKSDANCTGPDAASGQEKEALFRAKYDCLSKEASDQLMHALEPRLIVSGHTHRFCLTVHDGGVPEWTVPSFSWRNIRTPSFLLATVSPSDFSIHKCFLPDEDTVIASYVIVALAVCTYVIVTSIVPCISLKLKRVCMLRKIN